MARIRCPRCGNETARIIYGNPKRTEKLLKDLAEKSVYIMEDMMEPPPKRFCFPCNEGVCYSFNPIDEKETQAIEFEIGGFFSGFSKLVVERNELGYFASLSSSLIRDDTDVSIELTEEEYREYVHRIYMTYIKEWDESYVNPNVLDGTSWTITIRYEGGMERQWYGCNAYPPLWKRFLRAVNSLDLPDIR